MNLDARISNILLKMGASPALLGYQYIKTGVSIIIENKCDWRQVTKVLYPEVAKVHGTTPSKVERAIRHCVEKMYFMGNIRYLTEIIPSYNMRKGKVANSEFLATLAEYLKQEGDRYGLPMHHDK